MVHVGFVSHIIFQAGEVISSFHPLYSSQRFSEVAFCVLPSSAAFECRPVVSSSALGAQGSLGEQNDNPRQGVLRWWGPGNPGRLGIKLRVKSLASGAFCLPNTENEKAQPPPRRFLIASYNQFQITIISL